MFEDTRLFAKLLSSAALILALGFSAVRAQDSALEDIQYKEDYDRIQTILKVTDVLKRGDRILAMYRERPDMNPQLRNYLDNLFVRDLENLMKQQNFVALRSLCDRALKVRPRFGEVYMFQGIVLKNEKKPQEAMTAFARSYVLTTQPATKSIRSRAKQQLDLLYRAANGGSLIGQEKMIKESMQGLK